MSESSYFSSLYEAVARLGRHAVSIGLGSLTLLISVWIALFGAFTVALYTLIAPEGANLLNIPPHVAWGWSLIMPSNFFDCINLSLSAKLLAVFYRHKLHMAKLMTTKRGGTDSFADSNDI